MTSVQTVTGDKLLRWGWALLLASSAVYCTPYITPVSSDQYLSFFAFHFGLAVTYYFILVFNKGAKVAAHRLHYQFIKLIMALISAYALNREMEVFAASPFWFSALLLVLCIAYLAGAFTQWLPVVVHVLLLYIYGIALAVFIYLSIYLLPLYFISIPALLVLGISIHTFVPLLFSIFTLRLVKRLAQNNRRYWLSFGAGLFTAVFICIGFAVLWNNKVQFINRQYTAAMAEGEDKLPLWVQVAQGADRSALGEAVLKTNLIYKIPKWQENFFWSMPGRNFSEQQQLHDPLVVIASLFSGAVLLTEEDRIKILESQYNARHQALERLWTGEHLKTEQVTTNVKVWPGLHLAYTEKLITVYNHQSRQAWANQGEGIYTLHLPEGGVVTSLSLWIHGKEEKGVLTSKQAASTAYRTVVGYERRDPSVVHWQEGSTVTVRVFPVVAGSSRTFKIGVTAPLRKAGVQLVYDNIWFDGPDAAGARESVKIEMVNSTQEPITDASFTTDDDRTFIKSTGYKPRWTVAFDNVDLQNNSFSFQGFQYSLKPYRRQRTAANIADVFMDVNSAWSTDDLKNVWEAVKNKRVWIYNGELTAVSAANKERLFLLLQKQSFSLFPFYLIPNREQSLVITKSDGYSPTVADLEGSPFLKSLQAKVDAVHRIKLFHIGADLSPYIRSLKELRCFDFEYGEPSLLTTLLAKDLFVKDTETDAEVIVHSAEVVIAKQPGDTVSTAPDHLMRLFAYNHILQQLGRKEATSVADSTALVKEAEEAYVVSPVSSLIVLETEADYDRFGIKDSENSLKNASLKGKGAVPEPAEWAIILLLGAGLLLFLFKTKLA